ncbi:amidohydrolase [Paraoerskovia sediminicola]|uniref:Amidohydrolase n=1 Tax=Paraoerskovia sediminicola TaxID=1138587 RepID=A0ABN6XD43_9CELL|nr:amidohydrolase family protein [Paraoerskovia sediminicola]BDZ42680.1 amidohydrolase [Paraoerskovia sediminicola]
MSSIVTVLHDARIPGRPEPVDVLVLDDGTVEVGPSRSWPEPGAAGSPIVVDVEGRWVVPGLWDEHVHMLQWSLARARVDLSATRSAAEAVQVVADHLAVLPDTETAPRVVGDVVVGFGFRDAMWPDLPTRAALDAVAGDVAVVLVGGDCHCGWVSSAAAQVLGAEVDASGILREEEWFEVSRRLDRQAESELDGLVVVAGTFAAARGVVGIVDLEMADNVRAWQRRVAAGATSLQVEVGVYADRLEEWIAAGRRSGDVVPDTGDLVRIGPLKVMSDGSLNTRTAFCCAPYAAGPDGEADAAGAEAADLAAPATEAHEDRGALDVEPEELRDLLLRATGAGIETTVHAIGDAAVGLVLDTYAELGIGGRMEHAQLVARQDLPRFAELGVVASVQPEHAMDDRDVVDRYWAGTSAIPYPLASLVEAGATVRLGSDAPVATLDPWAAMAAAVHRARDGREAWRPEERIDVRTALAAHARGRDEVRTGDVADLVVVDRDPFGPDEPLRDMPVWATMVGGRWTFRA